MLAIMSAPARCWNQFNARNSLPVIPAATTCPASLCIHNTPESFGLLTRRDAPIFHGVLSVAAPLRSGSGLPASPFEKVLQIRDMGRKRKFAPFFPFPSHPSEVQMHASLYKAEGVGGAGVLHCNSLPISRLYVAVAIIYIQRDLPPLSSSLAVERERVFSSLRNVSQIGRVERRTSRGKKAFPPARIRDRAKRARSSEVSDPPGRIRKGISINKWKRAESAGRFMKFSRPREQVSLPRYSLSHKAARDCAKTTDKHFDGPHGGISEGTTTDERPRFCSFRALRKDVQAGDSGTHDILNFRLILERKFSAKSRHEVTGRALSDFAFAVTMRLQMKAPQMQFAVPLALNA
ncbi:hypothetical protein DBV15_01474 [Temnothorax longispinosus]|uniref:Uncharacterized protein n=1 Tax=Temnothorax longispinosus TaxID=300112 RepID=A0A4S2KZ76_9HYME|nr:hypothetical protein DBV15_01474 [Temnothorax longispinosus]